MSPQPSFKLALAFAIALLHAPLPVAATRAVEQGVPREPRKRKVIERRGYVYPKCKDIFAVWMTTGEVHASASAWKDGTVDFKCLSPCTAQCLGESMFQHKELKGMAGLGSGALVMERRHMGYEVCPPFRVRELCRVRVADLQQVNERLSAIKITNIHPLDGKPVVPKCKDIFKTWMAFGKIQAGASASESGNVEFLCQSPCTAKCDYTMFLHEDLKRLAGSDYSGELVIERRQMMYDQCNFAKERDLCSVKVADIGKVNKRLAAIKGLEVNKRLAAIKGSS